MRNRTVSTILVGSNALLREGISRILSTCGFRILASTSRLDDCVLGSVPRDETVLLVVDACNDHGAAIDQIVCLKQHCPAARIAVLSEHYRIADVLSACRAGVHGYFAKVSTCEAFVKSLELLMLGETILPVSAISSLLDHEDGALATEVEHHTVAPMQTEDGPAPHLSPQERSILHCLMGGDSNKTIARKLHVTEATVKVHVKAILRKVRAQNRTQAAIWAINNGYSPGTAINGDAHGASSGRSRALAA